MQEEIEQKSFNLMISTTKLSARTVLRAVKVAFRLYQSKASQGKQSVRTLLRQNRGVSSVEISKTGIRGLERYAKKYGIDYAIRKDTSEVPPRYLVFFKAPDAEAFQALCKQADDEIARLEQELKALSPAPEPQTVSSDMKAIYDFLSQKVDVHGARLAPELIDQFVEVVTPFADYSYRWKLNTGCKKSKEERTDLMAVSERPILTFTIDFETAKRYREANKMPHQFRRAAWTDLTVEVYL